MANKMSTMLSSIVDASQAPFVPGKHIQDRVILAYELIKGYSSKRGGGARCMLQMDIKKAYDSMEWKTLEDIMEKLSLPNKFIRWTMSMVSSVSFSYKINNVVLDSVKAKRGLRQGDPLSPLLFVLILEYLYRTLQKMGENPKFNYHSKCDR